MDTRQRRPRSQNRRPANKRPAPARRRREEPERKKRPAAARRPQRRTRTQSRVVRPPRADVPEVVYTIPRPLTRGKFLLRLASVFAAVVAVMMALSVFFRVDTVTVLGAEKYTAWAVREASGIVDGEALLTLSKARAAGRIKAALPYVDEVKIELKLPGTVHIEIREHDVVYAFAADDDRWWLVSADGMAVEPVEGAVAGKHTQIYGLRIAPPTAGSPVEAAAAAPVTEPTEEMEETENEPVETGPAETGETTPETTPETVPVPTQSSDAQRLAAVLEILQSMEDNGIIGKVDSVNVENILDIRLTYDERLHVRLGNTTKLGYKIEYLARAVGQMEPYQTGVFDLTFEHADYGILDPEQ